ncbi:MAG: protein-export chaperone SecB [Pseudomonadota bacterium]
MTDATEPTGQAAPAAAAPEENQEHQFIIQRIYLKDLSYEAPIGAQAFTTQIQPKVDQELATESKKIADNLYEAVLKLTITAKVDDKPAFLVEVQQAGLFFIQGAKGKNLSRVLNTVCPSILFPYARETIDSTLVKGSFPPVMLPPINFDALFVQAMENKKEKAH